MFHESSARGQSHSKEPNAIPQGIHISLIRFKYKNVKQGDFTPKKTREETSSQRQHGHDKWNRQAIMEMNINTSESSGH